MLIVAHETLDWALDEATGLTRDLRRYLTCLLSLPDQNLPLYLYRRKLTNLDGSDGLFIDPRVIRREDSSAAGQPDWFPGSGALPDSEEGWGLDPEEPTRGWMGWEQVWPGLSRAILVGSVGAGKSVVARMTVHRLARRGLEELRARAKRAVDVTLPVWLPLTELVKQGLLTDAVYYTLPKPEGKRLGDRLVSHLRKSLLRSNCWLVLDSYDEALAADRELVTRELAELANGKSRILLTGRPWAMAVERPPLAGAEIFEIAPLLSDQQQRFLTAWFKSVSGPGRRESVESLACDRALEDDFRNPLLLALACAEVELRGPGHIENRAQLYYWIVGDLLGGAWQERSSPPPKAPRAGRGASPQALPRPREVDPRIGGIRRALERAAWDLFQAQPGRVEFAEVTWLHSLYGQGESRETATELIDVWWRRGLLVPVYVRDGGGARYGWAFTHPSFLAYLAAEEVASLAGVGKRKWCGTAVRVLGRNPGRVLGMVEFLGGRLPDGALLRLALEVIVTVPAVWASWADVLQALLAGTPTRSAVLDTLREAAQVAALRPHPEALLAWCHHTLSSSPEPDCQALARAVEQAAAARRRFWCRRDRPDAAGPPATEERDPSCAARLHYFVPVRQMCTAKEEVFSLSQNGTLASWNPTSGAIVYVDAAQQHVSAFAVLPDDRLLVGTAEGTVLLCSAEPAHPEPRRLYREKSPVTALLVCPRGKVAIVGHGDGLLVRLKLGDRPTPLELGWHRGAVRQLVELADEPTDDGGGARPAAPARCRVASGGDDGVVRWWCLEEGVEESRAFAERYGGISRLAWCRASQRVVSGHVTGAVASWPVAEGQARLLLRGDWPISTLAATGHGQVFVGDKGGRVYELGAGGTGARARLVHPHLAPVAGLAVRGNQVHSVDDLGNRKTGVFDGPGEATIDTERLRWLGGTRLVCANHRGEVEVVGPGAGGRAAPDRLRPDRAVIALAVPKAPGPDVVVAGGDGTVHFGTGPDGLCRRYREPLTSLVAAGEHVAAGTVGGKVLVFDALGKFVRVLSASRARVTALAWWAAERCLVCGDASGRVRLLPLPSALEGETDARVPLPVTAGAALLCLEAVDGLGVVACCDGGTVACLRPGGKEFEPVRPPPPDTRSRVLCLTAWGGGRAAAGRADGTLGWIALGGGGPFLEIFGDAGKEAPTRSLARWALPDGTPVLVSGHRDGKLRRWSALDRQPTMLSTPHRGPVTVLAASGPVLASSAAGGVVCLRHWGAPQDPTKYLFDDTVTALAWLRGGRLAVGLSGGALVVLTVRGLPPEDGFSRP